MTGILKVDQWKDSGDNALITSDGSGALTINSSANNKLTVTGGSLNVEDGYAYGYGDNSYRIEGKDDGANARIGFVTGNSEIARFTTSGLHLGGTGSANALDDYEEGTFTPTAEFAATQPTAGATTGTGFYTKVGDMVTVWGTVENFNVTGASGDLRVRNLPFTSKLSAALGGFQGTAQISNINYADGYVTAEVPDNLTYVRFAESIDNAARDFINKENCSHGASDVYFCVTYKTG